MTSMTSWRSSASICLSRSWTSPCPRIPTARTQSLGPYTPPEVDNTSMPPTEPLLPKAYGQGFRAVRPQRLQRAQREGRRQRDAAGPWLSKSKARGTHRQAQEAEAVQRVHLRLNLGLDHGAGHCHDQGHRHGHHCALDVADDRHQGYCYELLHDLHPNGSTSVLAPYWARFAKSCNTLAPCSRFDVSLVDHRSTVTLDSTALKLPFRQSCPGRTSAAGYWRPTRFCHAGVHLLRWLAR